MKIGGAAGCFVDGSDFGRRRERRGSPLLEEAGFGENIHLVGSSTQSSKPPSFKFCKTQTCS